MQTKPLNLILFTAGAALVATFLTFAATTVRAGIFDVPTEPADWNGPFVAFDAGGAFSNFHWTSDPATVDLTRQFNIATGATNAAGNFIPNNATDVNLIAFQNSSHSSDDAAFLGGIDLGYNKQIGHFVFGGSFGFSGTKQVDNSTDRGSSAGTIVVNPGTPQVPEDVNYSTGYRSSRKIDQEFAGYAGGQIGFAWNRLLFYATGGAAFAQIDIHSYDAVTTLFATPIIPVVGVPPPPGTPLGVPATQVRPLENNTFQVGWFAGGGIQFAFNDAVTAGVEYRHNDYGDTEYHYNTGPKGSFQLFPGATTVSYDNNEVVFKVTILLGHLGEKHAPAPGMTKK